MERTVEEAELIDKLNAFADKLDAELLSDYSKEIESGVDKPEKGNLTGISYYERWVLQLKQGMQMSLDGIYLVETEKGNSKEIKIYKDVKDLETGAVEQKLIAKVEVIDEKNVIVFEGEYMQLNEAVADKELDSILKENDAKAELNQETHEMLETSIANGETKKEDVKKLEEESQSKEELEAKVKLGITPGTSRVLTGAETRGFPEFKGRSVAIAYSKTEHSYVAYDQNTGDILMGPSVGYTRTASVQRPDGEITEQRGNATMVSERNSDKMITIKIGQYGELELYETDRTPENKFVSRQMETEGREDYSGNSKVLRDSMDKAKTLDNMGETIEIMMKLGVEVKKHPEIYKITRAEMESMLDELRTQYDLTQSDLEDLCQSVANNLSEENRTLRIILDTARRQLEQEKRSQIEMSQGEDEGYTPGDAAYDKRFGDRQRA